jgi:hypothetical protein
MKNRVALQNSICNFDGVLQGYRHNKIACACTVGATDGDPQLFQIFDSAPAISQFSNQRDAYRKSS